MEEEESKLASYDTELENGIFNMVIALCQHKATTMGIQKAKVETAKLLESLAVGLCKEEDTIT